MIDSVEVVKTLLPTFGVILTGAIGVATYTWQENIKRQTEIVERKQKLYEDLNGALFGLILAQKPEERREIIARIEKGWLFASDDVLVALFAYLKVYDKLWANADGDMRRAIATDAQIRQQIQTAMADIFLAMRRDLRSTHISSEVAREYMQFYQFGMLNLD